MSEGEFVLFILGIIAVIVILGRYAIIEGQRIEQHKEFIKNINKHDNKLKKSKNGSRN
jgi:uncharacterized membrane protein (DUF106 family)|tara:strand:- start:105 stop:278 length:174 start_codon:yes stop_codon:yes gene_type:complete